MNYQQHPLGACYPPLSPQEFQHLKDSLKSPASKPPAILYEDKILDGWHYYKACLEEHIEPLFETPEIENPIEFITRRNEGRRNLSVADRAEIALKLANVPRGGTGANRYTGKRNSTDSPTGSSVETGRVTKSDAMKAMKVGSATMWRKKTVNERGIPELKAALEAKQISLTRAAEIATLPAKSQLAEVEKWKKAPGKKETKPPPPPASPPTETKTETATKTGHVAAPEAAVPKTLMRGVLTADQVAKGFALYSDVNGNPCALAPDVSVLEHKDRAKSFGGSVTMEARKSCEKWDKFHEEKIAEKVLKVLERMSPVEVPKDHKLPPFTYVYDLKKAADLEELSEMLCAHLNRMAEVIRLKEKYGHLF